MAEIFNEIRNGLDIPYMLVVNVVTYLIIKSIIHNKNEIHESN